ncbi:MAG: hypothetical protein OEV55_09975 [candidate division Zixibacteria bacterium]|nr:hypothetical protein [candidate division Zixibacteria bacterium]
MLKELLKADEIKVALVTGACIIASALIFKKVLHIEADSISSHAPSYLFIIYIISKHGISKGKKKQKRYRPLYWNLGIIFITALTIIRYVI